MFSTVSDGWDAWLAASPEHQVILGMDLIPQSVSDDSDPLAWEQPCASGEYDQYATTLAKNLVSSGAGNVVIRLGVEANGSWEADYVGTTSAEMSDWAKCFDNEVTVMRGVAGANFLFVWNPNSCTADLPINKWYPGNSYVNIIGIDVYDKDCETLKTVSQEGWIAYSTDSASGGATNPYFPSLANVEAFAAANGKSMSFPEWGLSNGDDAIYIAEIAHAFDSRDFAFETYFDVGGNGTIALGGKVPNATAAYMQAFKLPLLNCEPFSSWLCCVDLQGMDGLGKFPGTPGTAAELAEDSRGLEPGVGALAGARSFTWAPLACFCDSGLSFPGTASSRACCPGRPYRRG
jgi:hypothetical protein